MRFRRLLILCVFVILSFYTRAQQPASLSPTVQKYVRVNAPRVVLEHVRVIDGTGQAPLENQNVVIEGGKITAVQPGSDAYGWQRDHCPRLARLHGNARNRRHAQPSFLRCAAG